MNSEMIHELVCSGGIKAVCFELSGTLLVPVAIRESALFQVVGLRCNEPLFKKLRLAAGQLAASRLKGGREVPTLSEIYASYRELTGVSKERTCLFERTERQVTLRYHQPRKTVQAWYNAALAAGKHIVIVADTGMPRRHVETLLRRHGYAGWSALWLSSEDQLPVSGEEMQAAALDALTEKGILPREVVYLGGSTWTAKAYGAHVLPIASPAKQMSNNKCLSFLTTHNAQAADSDILYGLVANTLFDDPFAREGDDSLTAGAYGALGTALLGPILLAVMRWVAADAETEGLDRLFFVWRDGYLPIQVYRKLRRYFPGAPPPEKLYASRAMLYALHAGQRDGLLRGHLELSPSPAMPVGQYIRHRLLAKTPQAEATAFEVFKRYGYDSLSAPIGYLNRDYTLLVECGPLFQANGEKDIASLDGYYHKKLKGVRYPGVFDLGYSGRVARLLRDRYGKRNVCYHLAAEETRITIEAAKKYDIRAWYRKPASLNHLGILNKLLEDSLSSPEGSALGVSGFGAVLREPAPAHSAPKQAIQEAILDFCGQAIAILGSDIRGLHLEGSAFMQLYIRLFQDPHPRDAALIRDLGFADSSYIDAAGVPYYQNWYDSLARHPQEPCPEL